MNLNRILLNITLHIALRTLRPTGDIGFERGAVAGGTRRKADPALAVSGGPSPFALRRNGRPPSAVHSHETRSCGPVVSRTPNRVRRSAPEFRTVAGLIGTRAARPLAALDAGKPARNELFSAGDPFIFRRVPSSID